MRRIHGDARDRFDADFPAGIPCPGDPSQFLKEIT